MQESLTLQAIVSLMLSAFFLLSYRDAVKTCATWGAFEFKQPVKLTFLRKIPYSAMVLVVIPVALFFLSLRTAEIATVYISSSLSAQGPISRFGSLLTLTALIILLTLCPRSSKHLWALIARSKFKQGTKLGRSGYGWLNETIRLDQLPNPTYSTKVVWVLFVIPIVLIGLVATQDNILSFGDQPFRNVFVAIYVSEFVVLHETAKLRGYFSHKPEELFDRRIVLSIVSTIVIPVCYGLMMFQHVAYLDSQRNDSVYAFITGSALTTDFVLFIAGLFFPLLCNQSVLLVAQIRKWEAERVRMIKTHVGVPPEIKEGNRRVWQVFFIAALILLTFELLRTDTTTLTKLLGRMMQV